MSTPRSNSDGGHHEALALSCVETLGQLAALFDERRRQLADSVHLTVQQWQVLEEVQHEHFMPTMFAQQRASSAAAVSKILRQLTDKGLIFANVSASDARKRNYQVTKEGEQLLANVRVQRKQAIDQVWSKLTHEQLTQFAAVGQVIVDRLDRWADKRRPLQKKEGERNGQDALRKGV